ncbi:MAG: hypothetical protein OXI08_02480 [Cyanobacteria bacterium MAG IRC4_bin_6]|nr:hypothetical protein [Cyanobacteria bacterium MAG IRC4_bin_6]
MHSPQPALCSLKLVSEGSSVPLASVQGRCCRGHRRHLALSRLKTGTWFQV